MLPETWHGLEEAVVVFVEEVHLQQPSHQFFIQLMKGMR
jgi:hypothetical protein